MDKLLSRALFVVAFIFSVPIMTYLAVAKPESKKDIGVGTEITLTILHYLYQFCLVLGLSALIFFLFFKDQLEWILLQN